MRANYQYAKFKGVDVLNEYFKEREYFISSLDEKFVQKDDLFALNDFIETAIEILEWKNLESANQGMHLNEFDVNCELNTIDLMRSLVLCVLNNKRVENEIFDTWLGRLIQRFEVSGKLFTSYLPGFKKGVGTHKCIALYIVFSVLLLNEYQIRHDFRCLSTLIKISDLCCSLNLNDFYSEVEARIERMVLLAELTAVRKLAQHERVLDEA